MARLWDAAFLDLQRHIDEMFEELIYRPWAISTSGSWRPPLDIHETADAYLVQLDLPGMPPDDVQILATDSSLTIHGQRRILPPPGVLFQQCERPGGAFQRTVNLARAVDPQRAHAEYRHGVYTIFLPKKTPASGEQEAPSSREPGYFVVQVTRR